MTGLVEDYIKEEVYVREAVATGLDRDDTIIRRHLRGFHVGLLCALPRFGVVELLLADGFLRRQGQ